MSLIRRSVFVLPCMILFCSVIADGRHSFAEYINPEFRYRIEFPADLLEMQENSVSLAGASFWTKDRKLQTDVNARYARPGESLEKLFNSQVDLHKGEVTSKSLSEGSFIVEGIKVKTLKLFIKTSYWEADGKRIFCTFSATYPLSDKEKFEKVVVQMAATLGQYR